MIIKIDDIVVDIPISSISGARSIREYIIIEKEKQKTQKRNSIDAVLKHRALIKEYLNKSDEDLINELKGLNKKVINLDRFKMFKAQAPFKIE